MKLFILPVVLITAFFFSFCKKNKQNVPEEELPALPVAYDNYSALKVGNYWIYGLYDVDSLGNATPLNIYDSCYVQKDTLINGRTFFKVYRPDYTYNSGFIYLRDSLHYIVHKSGAILFSSVDFNTTFSTFHFITQLGDTFYVSTSKMEYKNKLVSVPAGTFEASDFKQSFTYMHIPSGSFMKNRAMVTYYAKGVGIVYETLPFYSSVPSQRERRLLRYHVN
jgi:hypothetical protein